MKNCKKGGALEQELSASQPIQMTFNSRQIGAIYSPNEIEVQIYDEWAEKGYFRPEISGAKAPFTIMMPPPNITGQLHMGHALDNTLQDIIARWRRMQGFSTLWMPGTDHASIATEAKIVESLCSEGLTKEQIGREEFLRRAWDWKKHYGGKITAQLRKLGCSCDWSRERFTLDEGLSRAVRESFVRLYREGFIYRGERIINWCPKCNTSISDAEVEYEQNQSYLWYIKYEIKDSKDFVAIATTRPETILGDVAVAVNPRDKRYTKVVGKTVIVPLVGREVPIIADNYVDEEFGTGAVKITPAHDVNDFEIGLRHNLPIINIMNRDATLNDNAGQYCGMDRMKAREQILKHLDGQGLIADKRRYQNNVGTCYRCGEIVEPLMSEQWFVRMESLAKPAIEAVRKRDVKFIPVRFTKIYLNWMKNIRDWCISRQLWWGHRIPAYYCQDCDNIMVNYDKPAKCTKCNSTNIRQDEDTLDTWFSSALWPFSTLGWPDETADLDYFYPTSVLVTAYDIIFFWVARMIFSALNNMGQAPFEYVFIHGIIRDAEGRKMSKSLGNGVDPIEVIEKYGADALRFGLITGTSAGNDSRFSVEKVEAGRNFTNKIWNAARFILMNMDGEFDFANVDTQKFTAADQWILSRLNAVVSQVTRNMQKFEFGMALHKIYEFIREEFCDWYIEMVKPRLYDKDSEARLESVFVLNYVMKTAMKLLHPYMPFITEKIYSNIIKDQPSIMISEWPQYDEGMECFEDSEREISMIISLIKAIRSMRQDAGVPPSKKADILFVVANAEQMAIIRSNVKLLERLASGKNIIVQFDKKDVSEDCMSVAVGDIEIYIPVGELMDVIKETERLENEIVALAEEINFVKSKLDNKNFMSKAPSKVIQQFENKMKVYQLEHEKTVTRLNLLKKFEAKQ